METLEIVEDITVYCILAASFPEGIAAAQKQLNSLLPFREGRKYYGISRPENGTIIYWAGATITDNVEAPPLMMEPILLKSGAYVSMIVRDFPADTSAIGTAFKALLTQPGLDPLGYCVEAYINDKDVQCMIRLDQ